MKIYVVGSSKNKFLPLDSIREKFLIDSKHEGDNIDFLNPWYCELTGLYYLWKHVDDDIVGLEHYRRYFVNNKGNLLSENDIIETLKTYDIICRKFDFKGRTAYSFFSNERKAYLMKFLSFLPDEESKFIKDDLTNKKYFEQCNMFICKKHIISMYMEWFFDYVIIFSSKELLRSPRIIGYISEFVFGSWLKLNKYRISYNPAKEFNKEMDKLLFTF